MSKNHKKVCTALNYVTQSLILDFTITLLDPLQSRQRSYKFGPVCPSVRPQWAFLE